MTVEKDNSQFLFSPFSIKNISLQNRFVMPAMQRGHCEEGRPTAQMANYFRSRVEGGVSLIIGESSAVDHPSATSQVSAAKVCSETIADWRHCVDAVKAAGGEMLLQLWHEGAVRKEPSSSSPSLSPSGLVQVDTPNGRAATIEELAQIRDAFVSAAVDAQALGAAGVEIHAAHGYFLDLFLWPQTNRREDQYGGDTIEQRLSYPAEIVSSVRKAVGEDFIISFRFSQWKEVDFTASVVKNVEELKTLVQVLEKAGVDIFNVSTQYILKPEWPELSDKGLAEWTKSFTNKPVIAVGSVGLDTDLMANLFGKKAFPTGKDAFEAISQRAANGAFDLVAVGRAVIGDAGWVNKAKHGRWSEMKTFSTDDMSTGNAEWEMDFVLDAHQQ